MGLEGGVGSGIGGSYECKKILCPCSSGYAFQLMYMRGQSHLANLPFLLPP